MWDVPSSEIFCSSCILMLPGVCCIYFSNPFFTSPRALLTTGIVVAFIPHFLSISISRSLYFDSFSVTLFEVFFSVGIDISISRQLFSSLFLITMSGLLAFISRSVFIGISRQIVILSFYVTVWGWCSHHFSFVFIFIYLQMFQCRYVGLCKYPVLASPGHPATIWSIVSWNWPQILHIGSVASFRILPR